MRPRGNLSRKFGLLFLIGSGILVFGDYGRDFIAVDRCLDDGKVYDYREGRCRNDVSHLPYVPYAERRPALLGAVGALVICGLGLIAFGPEKGSQPYRNDV